MSDQNPLEPRVKTLEEIAQTLTTLLVRADERMDRHEAWINQLGESQARVENNLAALTDIVVDLGRAQARTEETVAKLVQAQAHTDQRLDALIDIVQGGHNGQK
jgi:hypothetical protein